MIEYNKGPKGEKGDAGENGTSGADGSAIILEASIALTNESLIPNNTATQRYVIGWIKTEEHIFTKIFKDNGSSSGLMDEITPIAGQIYVFKTNMTGRYNYYQNIPYTWVVDEDSDFLSAETIGIQGNLISNMHTALAMDLQANTSAKFGLSNEKAEIRSNEFPENADKQYVQTKIISDNTEIRPYKIPEVTLPNVENWPDYPITTNVTKDSTFSPLRFDLVFLNPTDSTKRYFLRAIQCANKQVLVGEHAELWLRKNLTFSSRNDYQADPPDNQALVIFESLTGEQFHFGLVRTATTGFPSWVAVDAPFLYHNTQLFKVGGNATHYFSVNPNGTNFSLTRNSSPGLTYGTSTNFFNVLPDGTVRLAGAATAWDDLVADVATYREQLPAVNAPVLRKWKDNGSGSAGVFVYSFGKNAAAYSPLSFQNPHRWLEGSDIYPHVHWIPKTADVSTKKAVLWQLEYVWVNVGDVAPANSTVITTTTHAPDEMLVADKHYISAFSPISGAGKTLSSILRVTLSRQGGALPDDYDDEAYIIGFDLHYQVDSFGSAEEYVK